MECFPQALDLFHICNWENVWKGEENNYYCLSQLKQTNRISLLSIMAQGIPMMWGTHYHPVLGRDFNTLLSKPDVSPRKFFCSSLSEEKFLKSKLSLSKPAHIAVFTLQPPLFISMQQLPVYVTTNPWLLPLSPQRKPIGLAIFRLAQNGSEWSFLGWGRACGNKGLKGRFYLIFLLLDGMKKNDCLRRRTLLLFTTDPYYLHMV